MSNSYLFAWMLVCTFGASFSQCQAQSTVRVFVSADNPIIEIDDEVVQHAAVLDIKAGEHSIKIWAPKHKIVESKFNSYADSLVILKYDLELTEISKGKRNPPRFLPYPLVLAAATVPYFYSRRAYLEPAKQALADSDDYYEIYSESYDYHEIEEARVDFEEAQNRYKKMRNRFYIINGATILVTAAGCYLIYKHQERKIEKRSEVQKSSPLGLQSIGVGAVENVGLGINLKLFIR